MSDQSKYTAIHYNSYLKIDQIVSAQELRSEALGVHAHDEMLFIITHQVYELWFKQINHELKALIHDFSAQKVDERSIGSSVAKIDRIIEIMKLLLQQITVLETMTPLDFLDFRNFLFPASGFQSFQFREMEVMLGLKSKHRMTYNNKPYQVVFDDAKKAILKSLEEKPSLFELIEDWLERTPFLQLGDYNFLEAYKKALLSMLDGEKDAIMHTDILSDEYKQMRLRMLGDTHTYFEHVLDKTKYDHKYSSGEVRLSYNAMLAALFIHLYRDEPILHLPFQLLSKLVELDDLLTRWRYRHAQMVLRMIGKKVGTGGSSGHEYLSTTAARHHIFEDLHQISTLLIPRSSLPTLPDEIKKQLSYNFTNV